MRRNSVLLGVSFSLDPIIQADTPIQEATSTWFWECLGDPMAAGLI